MPFHEDRKQSAVTDREPIGHSFSWRTSHGSFDRVTIRRRPINIGLRPRLARINAPRVRNSGPLGTLRRPSRSYPERDESGAPDNALHFRHERTDTQPKSYHAARACQSIIRIGLLKFLGTDGERMDIHSFSPALTQGERTRSFDPVRSPRYIPTRTYACRTEEQPFRRGSRKLAI